MKKSIIALAALAAITAQAADNTTLYGRVAMAYNYNDGGKGDAFSSFDNAGSRFGIKGSEDLGNGLSAFYKYENRINKNLDTNKLYVGLQGGFGAVSFGLQSIPTDEVGKYDDPFNALTPAAGEGPKAAGSAGHSMKYMTPDMSGFQAGAAIVADGKGGLSKNHVDAYDVAVTYNANGIHAGLGYQDVVDAKDADIVTAALGYGNETFEVGVEAEARKDVVHARLAGLYNVTPMDSVYLGFASEFNDEKLEDIKGFKDDWAAAVGYQHKFSKRTKVWAEYSFADNSDVNQLSLGLRTDF